MRYLVLLCISLFIINVSCEINRDKIEDEYCSETNYLSFSEPQYICSIPSSKPEMKFIYEYFKQSEFKDLALEITAMSAVETGWWKSEFHKERNNYWSRKKVPDGITCIKWEKNCLITHDDILTSCQKMERYLKRKKYSRTDSELFLSQLKVKNFATDPNYKEKILYVIEMIKEKYCQKLDFCYQIPYN